MIFNINYDESKTKKNQRDNILNKAFQLFIEKGIQNVTMQEIAEEASIKRRTLYYYYESKEAIAIELIKCIFSGYKNIKLNAPEELITGYSKLEYMFHKLLEFWLENDDLILFMVQYDYYFNKEHYHQFIEVSNDYELVSVSAAFLAALRLGIDDGSIHTRYENCMEETLYVSLSAILAFVNRILFREEIIREESGYDRKNISLIVDIVLNGLKA